MTKLQRHKYECFVRVRDYGKAHAVLFPESSTGGQKFAEVTAAVAAIDEHLKNRVVARAEARKVKVVTRKAVVESMKTLALTARRVLRQEPGVNPFRVPQRRTAKTDIATARAFIEEAERRKDQFIRFGLPPTFISDFRVLVDQLQAAVDVRLNAKSTRRGAKAGIAVTLAEGLETIRDLDAIVAMTTRQDPTAFAAWQGARAIEGQSSAVKAADSAPAVAPVAEPAAMPATALPEALEAPKPPTIQQVMGRAS